MEGSAALPGLRPGLGPTWIFRLLRLALGTCRSVAGVALGGRREAGLCAWARRSASALGLDIRVAKPLPEGGALVVANHLSWVDPLVVMTLRPSLPLAKADVKDYPLVGWMVRRAGIRFVRREEAGDRARALLQMRADLAQGRTILLFPEGTTTQGNGLAPLYRGGLGLAWRMGLPVLPLRLSSPDAAYPWVGDATLGPHLLGLLRAHVTRVVVEPGPRLDPANFPTLAAWLHAVEAALSPGATPFPCNPTSC